MLAVKLQLPTVYNQHNLGKYSSVSLIILTLLFSPSLRDSNTANRLEIIILMIGAKNRTGVLCFIQRIKISLPSSLLTYKMALVMSVSVWLALLTGIASLGLYRAGPGEVHGAETATFLSGKRRPEIDSQHHPLETLIRVMEKKKTGQSFNNPTVRKCM